MDTATPSDVSMAFSPVTRPTTLTILPGSYLARPAPFVRAQMPVSKNYMGSG